MRLEFVITSMLQLLLLSSSNVVVVVLGFGFTTPRSMYRYRTVSSSSIIPLYGWLDFNPFHGSGSGDNQDFQNEQWEAQQAILKSRANKGLTKESLKKKYTKTVIDNTSSIKQGGDMESNKINLDKQSDDTSKVSTFEVKLPWEK